MQIHTADVVEREKIDKAIEEIKQEIQNGTIKITNGNERLFEILNLDNLIAESEDKHGRKRNICRK